MYVYAPHTCLTAMKARREGNIHFGTGVLGGCELKCECWELNCGPL